MSANAGIAGLTWAAVEWVPDRIRTNSIGD